MTHIMVPDGVLPWWLSAVGWLVAASLLGVAWWRLRAEPATRMVPLVAVMGALMTVAMSVEIPPTGYELHLTVLTGIVVGPWYGAVAALLFNVLRALVGDGAFTNIGLNTGIIWVEIATGAVCFAVLRALLPGRASAAAGLATAAALVCSTALFSGVVALSAVEPGALLEDAAGAGRGGMLGFLGVVAVASAVGIPAEAVLTGAIVAFVARVRPAILGIARTLPVPAFAP